MRQVTAAQLEDLRGDTPRLAVCWLIEKNNGEIVRGTDGVDVFAEQGLEVAAGVRQPIEAYVAAHDGLRALDGAFMQIPQAVAISRQHAPETIAWMRDVVDELLATGWVREALSRHGHDPALAASRPG